MLCLPKELETKIEGLSSSKLPKLQAPDRVPDQRSAAA